MQDFCKRIAAELGGSPFFGRSAADSSSTVSSERCRSSPWIHSLGRSLFNGLNQTIHSLLLLLDGLDKSELCPAAVKVVLVSIDLVVRVTRQIVCEEPDAHLECDQFAGEGEVLLLRFCEEIASRGEIAAHERL